MKYPATYVVLSRIWLEGEESYPREVARNTGMQYEVARKTMKELLEAGFLEMGLSTKGVP